MHKKSRKSLCLYVSTISARSFKRMQSPSIKVERRFNTDSEAKFISSRMIHSIFNALNKCTFDKLEYESSTVFEFIGPLRNLLDLVLYFSQFFMVKKVFLATNGLQSMIKTLNKLLDSVFLIALLSQVEEFLVLLQVLEFTLEQGEEFFIKGLQ